MGFCSIRDFVCSGFCPFAILFVRDFVQFGILSIKILFIRDFAFLDFVHSGLYPFGILSNSRFCPIRDFVRSGFCPIRDFVQFGILFFGILNRILCFVMWTLVFRLSTPTQSSLFRFCFVMPGHHDCLAWPLWKINFKRLFERYNYALPVR